MLVSDDFFPALFSLIVSTIIVISIVVIGLEASRSLEFPLIKTPAADIRRGFACRIRHVNAKPELATSVFKNEGLGMRALVCALVAHAQRMILLLGLES